MIFFSLLMFVTEVNQWHWERELVRGFGRDFVV